MQTVSIVGRPNVGKSSLFNRILGKRIAVVDPRPGVTRDRHYRDARWNGRDFTLVDTGGLEVAAREGMSREIAKQVETACEESDVILFLVDATVGVTDMDVIIGRKLRKQGADKVILVINKAESKRFTDDMSAFFSLGLGEGYRVSALHGTGVGDLLDRVCALLKAAPRPEAFSPDPAGALQVAVVGRPNVGKSSLVNKLLKQDRVIVTPLPGTTRDSVDTAMEYKGSRIIIIDTAGLRKKANVSDDVEYYCNVRTIESIGRCDMCVLLVDATCGVEEQDLKIVRRIQLLHKGMLLCFNKWDLRQKDHTTFDCLVARTKESCRELRHVPMVSVSALTGQRVMQVLDSVMAIAGRMETVVPSEELGEKVKEWVRTHPHPMAADGAVRIVSGDQVKSRYPIFRFYSTNAKNAGTSYKRYLANKIYETYDYEGCPVAIEFRDVERKRKLDLKKDRGADRR